MLIVEINLCFFRKTGVQQLIIAYIADFIVYLPNGDVEVIDIKGVVTETFNVKKKMFAYKYPHLQFILLKHVEKYGGFITLDEYNKNFILNEIKPQSPRVIV
ncbi:hypothetical protein AZF08_15945 [Bacillus gaemokensis]|nr:hypothetical protein AZF08_15945 [Bacillus gaemokensis]